jgi:hypothetical protein
MTRRGVALAVGALVYLFAAPAPADPILKPHKYHGPIPQSSISLRVGMLGEASNEEMIDFLDERVPQSADPAVEEDFGNGLTFEISYTHKPHPHFAVRFNASVSLLRSEGSGTLVLQDVNPPDSLMTALDYKHEFNVDLIVVEASGVYHFSDASVKEFQPYLGAGFSVGFPHEVFKETRVDSDTGEPYTDVIPGIPAEASDWGVSAGVHAVGGLIYYVSNRVGIVSEGRLQMMQGRFEQLQTTNEVGELENLNFVVDYSGFYLTVGMSYGF